MKLYLSGITGRCRLDIHYNRLRKQEVMAKNDSSYSARLMALIRIHKNMTHIVSLKNYEYE